MDTNQVRRVRKRRRAALSCVECRRRKIKCDRNDPCAHCVATGGPCVFDAYHRATPAPEGAAQPASSSASTPSRTANLRETASPAHGLVTRTASQNNTLRHVDLADRSRLRDKTAAGTDPSERDHRLSTSDAIKDTAKLTVLDKTRIRGWSQWLYGAKQLEILGGYMGKLASDMDFENDTFRRPEMQPLVNQSMELMNKCKTLARRMKRNRPSRTVGGSSVNLELPSDVLARPAIASYFEHFESAHRILHVPSFWAAYDRERATIATHDLSVGTRLMILLVIALGSSVCPTTDDITSLKNGAHRWIHAAQAWLAGPMEKDRLSILGLQVDCLTLWARLIYSIGGDLVWVSTGSLVNKAFQMGLHIDPTHLSPMTMLQAEIRRRLWATILDLVVQSSLDSSMPPRISLDDFNTQAPANINDEDLKEQSGPDAIALPRSEYTDTSMQLLLYDSLETRLHVARLINGLSPEIYYEAVLELTSHLVDSWKSCHAFLRSQSQATAFHHNLLGCLIRRFLIPLHCPFFVPSFTNHNFAYSRQLCLDTSLAIASPVEDEAFSRVLVIGGGMFRESIRYSISIISLELLWQTETHYAAGTMAHHHHQRTALKRTVEDLITLSLSRIRNGETNIKGYMFLVMVLAQVDSFQMERDCEYAVAEKGLESLKICYDMLEERVAAASLLWERSGSEVDGETENMALDLDFDFFLQDEAFSF